MISCDVTGTRLELTGDHLRHWGGRHPDGRVLAANNHHLTIDGEPWPVVAGEFHPQRYPRAEWPEAVRALKSAGYTMVSSYWFWNLVEPRRGQLDFTGANDIGAFARLCAEHELWFSPRIGPFNNAEFLLGGLPPWLFGLALVERSNHPLYLELVGRWYAGIGEQLQGMFWGDGGPVVVVQLENELSHAPNHWRTLFGWTATDHRGPVGEEFGQHMAELRRLAIAGGIAAPVFSMTGWRTAGTLPGNDFLPTYGGYMDLHHRPGPNSLLTTFTGAEFPYRGQLPVAFSELGTGSPSRAAYRPMSPAEMMVTTTLTRLGQSESIMIGHYMAHGGTNPVRGDGFGWMTKEPAFPLRSYDFWAPVGEFGQRRDSFRRARPLNLFVSEFGADLARMASVAVDDPVADPDDDRLRAVVRSDGRSGFVFLSNYGNNTPLSARETVELRVATDAGVVDFPGGWSIPSGGWAVLPFGLDLAPGLTLVSATAQPLARLVDDTWLFLHPYGDCSSVVVRDDAGVETTLRMAEEPVSIPTAAGVVQLLCVDRAAAEGLQLVRLGGEPYAVHSVDELTVVGTAVTLSRTVQLPDTGGDLAAVRGSSPGKASLTVLPSGRERAAELPAPRLTAADVRVEVLAPGRWLVRVAAGLVVEPDDLWVDLAYTGDVCRLFDAHSGDLLADDVHRGIPWRVKLGRFAEALAHDGVQFRAEPVVRTGEGAGNDDMLLDTIEGALEPASIDGWTLSARVSTTIELDPH